MIYSEKQFTFTIEFKNYTKDTILLLSARKVLKEDFMRRCFLLFVLCIFVHALTGQESLMQLNSTNPVEQAKDLYADALYPTAYELLDAYLTELSTEERRDEEQARFYRASALMYWKPAAGVDLMEAYLEGYNTVLFRQKAFRQLAQYYYDQQDYKAVITYYEQLDFERLDDKAYNASMFQYAYSHFVQRNFEKTIDLCKEISHYRDQYYYPTHYYLAMSQFYTNDLDQASYNFNKVAAAKAYQHRIPYYLVQIYFKQNNIKEVLRVGNEALKDPKSKNIKEIRGILGQCYFLEEDYPKAIEHLEYYVNNTQKLRPEDFYQLGFALYQTEQYEKAIEAFKELANEKNELGQHANNYLADCYLKTNDKEAAFAAFKRTTSLDFNPDLVDESTFNSGKLAADLGDDRTALRVLKSFDKSSLYYIEAQGIISNLLENTSDYKQALEYIDGLDQTSAMVDKAQQKLLYLYGMQLLLDEQTDAAKLYFEKASKPGFSPYFKAMSHFRLARIAQDEKSYQQSIDQLRQFFLLREQDFELPKDAPIHYANYMQAYNYLHLGDFTRAKHRFKQATRVKHGKFYKDALLRTADCAFKKRELDEALDYYNQAVSAPGAGTDYAMYQGGIILGLQSKPYDKLTQLDSLFSKYPKSSLADYSLYQSGETYLVLNELFKAQSKFRLIVDQYKTSPLYVRSLIKLGLVSFNQEDMGTAMSYYKEVFNHTPNAKESREALLALQEIMVDKLGQTEAFDQYLEQEAKLNLTEFSLDSLHFRSGDIPFENGAYQTAIENYTSYIKKYPKGFNRLEAHFKRAEAYLADKKFNQAFLDYEKVIAEGQSSFYESALDKAAILAYNVLKKYKKAYTYFTTLESVAQDEGYQYKTRVRAVKAADKLNKHKAVEKLANQVLQSPFLDNKDKLSMLFLLGKINMNRRSYDKAFMQLRQVLLHSSNNLLAAESRYLMAKIHYIRKNYKDSETLVRQNIEKSKPYPYWIAKSLMLLSDILIVNKDYLKAKAALQAILENFKADKDITEEATRKLDALLQLEKQSTRIESSDTDGTLKMEKGFE